MSKRKTIYDFLPGGESDKFVIDQVNGKPRILRNGKDIKKIKDCLCDDDHVCRKCYDPGTSENEVEKSIIEFFDNHPLCKITKTNTTGRKKGKTWIKAQKSERKGKADLILCYIGFYIEIEVKKPGEGIQSRDQQDQEIDTIRAKGQYWLVETLEETINEFNKFKEIVKN